MWNIMLRGKRNRDHHPEASEETTLPHPLKTTMFDTRLLSCVRLGFVSHKQSDFAYGPPM